MGKFGPFEFKSDFSSSDTSLASSSSDEEKKMKKKAKKGRDHKYRPDPVPAYNKILPEPQYKKKGEGMKKSLCQPPPADLPKPEFREKPINLPQNLGKIDEETARAALLKYVDSHVCWRTDAAQRMELSDLKLSSAFTYRCECFTEERKVKWKAQGYRKGDSVDPPNAGAAPQPWEMESHPKRLWCEEKSKMEVPHSASVRKCWYCKGKGEVKCRGCKGSKYLDCNFCNGSGKTEGPEGPADCGPCAGSGKRGCSRCNCYGQYKCKTCDGKKKLKWYVRNLVKWEKHEMENTFEDTDLPDDLVAKVKGLVLFSDEQEVLEPLRMFPEVHVIQFSQNLIKKMKDDYKKHRILKMRHTVVTTPVTEVTWKFEDQSGKFFVYGMENMVYFPDYPQQCCCSLL